MSSSKSKLRAVSAMLVLLMFALLVGCRGFFVNPTLTSLAIGPSNLSLAPATSYQMVATATYSDGSTGNVTGQSVWTSASPGVANFTSSNSGYITAAALANLPTLPGTTTVSASDGSVTSSTVTVTVCPVVESLQIQVNGSTSSASVAGGGTATFVANATFNGVTGTQPVTATVTWTIGQTAVISSIPTSGDATVNSGVANQSTTVYATLCGTTSNTVTVTASS